MQAVLFLISGYSGAGKTTGLKFLQSKYSGQLIYLGRAVLDEVANRQLAQTVENQSLVRKELRERFGNGIFAERMKDTIVRHLSTGENVFVDAILCLKEYEALHSAGKIARTALVAIEADFETRLARVSNRVDARQNKSELTKRDRTDREILGIEDVLALATNRVRNTTSMEAFHAQLDSAWQSLLGVTLTTD